NVRNLIGWNLNAHIASGYHNAVRRVNDPVYVLDSLAVFNLGNYIYMRGIVFFQNMLNLPDGVRVPHKGSRDKIDSLLNAEDDILFVFLRDRRKLYAYIRYINAFPLSQLPAV